MGLRTLRFLTQGSKKKLKKLIKKKGKKRENFKLQTKRLFMFRVKTVFL